MTVDYSETRRQIDEIITEIGKAQSGCRDHVARVHECLSRIVLEPHSSDVFSLKVDLDGVCASVAKIRDDIHRLIKEQTSLQSWFSVTPTYEEDKKTGFFSKLLVRQKKEPSSFEQLPPQPNAQEAFEKAKECNTFIFSVVEEAVDFLENQVDDFDAAIVDAKFRVIDLNRQVDQTDQDSVDVISRLKGRRLKLKMRFH